MQKRVLLMNSVCQFSNVLQHTGFVVSVLNRHQYRVLADGGREGVWIDDAIVVGL